METRKPGARDPTRTQINKKQIIMKLDNPEMREMYRTEIEKKTQNN